MSTRERVTLVQRMEQARLRTVADRAVRQGTAAADGPPPTHATSLVAQHPPGPHGGHHRQGHGPGHGHGHGGRSTPAAAVRPAHHHPHSQGHRHGHTPPGWSLHWLVQARPGEHLVLMPGQMHFGPHPASLRTLLGSCVAVTLWHPQRRMGGMCHYLLPSRARASQDEMDGRYGDEALEAMVQMLRQAGTDPADYHAHLYGGADTMPEGTNLRFNVGERNIEQGWSLIDRYGFQLQGVDVGEDVPRSVTLTLATGEVEMRRGVGTAPPLPRSLLQAPAAGSFGRA